jgi:hypothetical protein
VSLEPLHVVALLGCGCLVVCVAATAALVFGFGWALIDSEMSCLSYPLRTIVH